MLKLTTTLAAAVAIGLVSFSPAQAQLFHTWVAAAPAGSDANTCDRDAPCATFLGAFSKTSTGGEITCIDTGNFGGVTITHSITINCEGSRGGSLKSNGTFGFVVTLPATDVVVLRGLDFDGHATPCGGTDAPIKFNGAGVLHVQKSKINSFSAACSGLLFTSTGGAELYITESTINDNGGSAGSAGITIQNQSSSILGVAIANTFINNNFNGIIATVSGSGGIFFTVADTVVSGNSQNGITTVTNAGGITATLDNVKVRHNGGYGISPNGANTATRLSRSLVVGNNIGLNTGGGGQFLSYGDNRIDGNFTNISGPALTTTALK